jgi:hypothetical protein
MPRSKRKRVRWRIVLLSALLVGVVVWLALYFGMNPAARYLTHAVKSHPQRHPYTEATRLKIASLLGGLAAFSIVAGALNDALR